MAEIRFGRAVNGYGVGDLVGRVNAVSRPEIDDLITVYETLYEVADGLRAGEARHGSLRDGGRIELGMQAFVEGGFKGFTNTFENLHGLKQLSGPAVQRLMANGYGFGGKGN